MAYDHDNNLDMANMASLRTDQVYDAARDEPFANWRKGMLKEKSRALKELTSPDRWPDLFLKQDRELIAKLDKLVSKKSSRSGTWSWKSKTHITGEEEKRGG